MTRKVALRATVLTFWVETPFTGLHSLSKGGPIRGCQQE